MPDKRPCSCGCGVNTFSTGEADADLQRYRENGPDGTTRALIDAIKAEGIEGATLLDVGGGIGAIQLELLAAGLASAQSVDASEGYVAVARAEAQRRGFADRSVHRFGTLVDVATAVQPADIVTLDRVVCCDPDVGALLAAVTSRAGRMVGLVYPRVTFWNRIAARAMAAFSWLTRDPTRWYLHPVAEIDGPLRRAGFEPQAVDRTLIWQVALYTKPAGARRGPAGGGG
jgi:hypothetical protein